MRIFVIALLLVLAGLATLNEAVKAEKIAKHEAYVQGVLDGEAGIPSTANPYSPTKVTLYEAWIDGWRDINYPR